MPASNPRAIAKARTLPADAIILDLEDAVAPERKTEAREAALAAVTAGFGGRLVVIRANSLGSEWGADDLAALTAAPVDAVLMPKVEGPADLQAARDALGGDGPALWAMIETAIGLVNLPAIAEAATTVRLEALVAGTNDLALDLRCRPDTDRAPLLPALAQIVAAARAMGALALDGVLNAIDDPGRLAAECAQGAAWGFDGKTLIHPSQVEAANVGFGPTAEEVEWARRVAAAFADPDAVGRGAIRVDGAMVERLHLAQAERILAIAETG